MRVSTFFLCTRMIEFARTPRLQNHRKEKFNNATFIYQKSINLPDRDNLFID